MKIVIAERHKTLFIKHYRALSALFSRFDCTCLSIVLYEFIERNDNTVFNDSNATQRKLSHRQKGHLVAVEMDL